ncbi:hypothetical protein BXZ70DRAFT_915626 [Cristinia sonorae]|uniref:Enoyl reductase (ER) domain-containing protein n=1 Tax=Cristinia sonorae TaxID=1940300 RepID=A0A8K0XUD7_9AGAR|nr:hypothetical protein BXZ70DRAFT_915626 [Cristinia sonorae]
MPQRIPQTTRVLVVQKSSNAKPVYPNDAFLTEWPIPQPEQLTKEQILVRINAVSFNYRDLWIRKGLYPGIKPGSAYGADGAGVVVASGIAQDPLMNQRVFLVPMRGWETNPEAPETRFTILGGGGDMAPLGTFAQYAVVERDQVILTPPHVDDEHISAFPVGGVTAWRAVSINAKVQKGQNVLITGIGGGVALIALQLCLARGANVYVTSGSEDKIRKAVNLGAKGGVNYKDKDWPAKLSKLIKEHSKASGNLESDEELSAVIDSAGGDIMGQVSKYLKHGGKVVIYGMTASPKVIMTMREVLKNQQLLGSTMGSHQDLIDATNFIAEHKIVPVVSHVLDGLESAEEGFKLVQSSDHFGKVVMRIRHGGGEKEAHAKL